MKSYPALTGAQVDNTSVAPAHINRRRRRTRRQCADWERDGRQPLADQPRPALAERGPTSHDVNLAKVAAAAEALDAGRLQVHAEAVADAMLSGALAGLRKYS